MNERKRKRYTADFKKEAVQLIDRQGYTLAISSPTTGRLNGDRKPRKVMLLKSAWKRKQLGKVGWLQTGLKNGVVWDLVP